MAEEEKRKKTLEEVIAEAEDLIERLKNVNLDDLFYGMVDDTNSTNSTIEDPFCEPDIFDTDDDVDFFAMLNTPETTQEEEKVTFPTTQTIKGNVINLNYVESIEKIDKEHNGNITYGVKFNFTGKKKFYRIVWFNTNVTQRDIVYDKQTKYLNQLKNTTH